MAVSPTDWTTYTAEVRDDTMANGGAQSWDEAISEVEGEVWPALTEAEAVPGLTSYRKTFSRCQSAANEIAHSARVYYAAPTPAGDRIYFHSGTDTDTQGDLTGSERIYGSGQLGADVASGTSVDVDVEEGTDTIFADGDEIAIIDATKTRYHSISGAPVVVGNTVTLTITPAIEDAWLAVGTTVSSVYAAGDVGPTVEDATNPSAAGTFDDSAVVPQSRGSYAGTITLTFTSATAFNAALDGTPIGSGNVASDFAPINANTGTAYISIPSSAWGGTFAIADTVAIPVHPPSVTLWEKRVVPAGTGATTGNSRTLRIVWGTA